MKTPRMLGIGLLWAVGGCGQQGVPTYTYALKPVVQTERGGAGTGYHMVNLGKDGEGEMPFTTASGKLRLKKTGEKILVGWDNDGKLAEVGTKDAARQIAMKIPVRLAGKAFEYPLSLVAMNGPPSDEYNQLVYVMGSVSLEAKFGQTAVRLYDTNLNGHFGDPGDNLQIGEKGSMRAVTKYVEIEGKIRELQVVNDGEALKLLPYTGPTATLKLKAKEGWSTEVKLVHAQGIFMADVVQGAEALLLPGAYQLEEAVSQFGNKTTVEGRTEYPIQFSSSGKDVAPIKIKDGQNSLDVGPPFRLEFSAARSAAGDGTVNVTDVVLIGAGGERCRASNYGSNGAGTLTCFVRSAGKEEKVADMEYG